MYGCDKAVPGDLVFEEEQAAKTGESDEINDSTVPAESAEGEGNCNLVDIYYRSQTST